MPTSPNSLTTIAVLAPSGLASRALIRVVLPEPRTPVTAMTGSLGPRARRWRRPKSGASLPAKRDPGPVSEIHFNGEALTNGDRRKSGGLPGAIADDTPIRKPPQLSIGQSTRL